jgi:hypothetical protein
MIPASKAVAMSGRARSLYGQVLATFAFVEPELITLGGWKQSGPTAGRLAVRALLMMFRKQAHIRSGEWKNCYMLADPFQAS